MKILLVYPRYPDTFWSFRHALRFISKKAAFPPLGLLTVAAMLPREWQKKLIDMNVQTLTDGDLKWADYVFVSAMSIQKEAVENVIRRCNRLKVKVVAGGPLFTTGYDQFEGVDHFVLNEAEATLPAFLHDLENGRAKHVYTSDEWPDITGTPAPLWELIDLKKYATMSVQYSRGCPFDCEFCDIIVLNGHRPRTKDRGQLLAELEALYRQGWRGGVFVVDDNFIGNKKKLKTEILPALIGWMEEKKHPFSFFTEASINLADDEELMQLMVRAGFDTVFVGIETPDENSLSECGKRHNQNRDLIASVKKIQNHGLQVQGGFIVGFDNDPPSIFERQINFIQNSGIVTAMVSLLNAPRGTKLYQRLKRENRLLHTDIFGDNASINFIPKMNYETLVNGYRRVINTIYSPKQYYERIKVFLKEYKPKRRKAFRPSLYVLTGFIKFIWFLGIKHRGRRYFWRLLFTTLLKYPRSLALSMAFAGYGFHFRKVVDGYNKTLVATCRQIVGETNP
ncbi:MAG TPA: DUF4070 domain-containing protein [Dehalococcoidia bacterium]|nr:DUF4070 domain-containing protein [Dehalococcoidia bacterium]